MIAGVRSFKQKRASQGNRVSTLTKRTDARANPDTARLIGSIPLTVNEYRFKSVLGSGCNAVVFLCHHSSYNRDFAAKCIPLSWGFADSVEAASAAEVRNLSRLCHPNIIKLYNWFEAMNHLILIFELCMGGTLRKVISSEVRMSARSIITYLEQIVSGLRFSHENNIAHLDIKPSNMFLDMDQRVKIADFGLSLLHTETDDEGVNAICGALVYQAPEVVAKKPYDPFKADVWAVGVMLYVMAVGQEPWPTYSLEKTREAILAGKVEIPDFVAPPIRDMIEKILIVDPKKRPSMADIDSMPPIAEARAMKAQLKMDSVKSTKALAISGVLRYDGISTSVFSGPASPRKKAPVMLSRSFEAFGMTSDSLSVFE